MITMITLIARTLGGSSPRIGRVGNLGKTDAKEPKSVPSKVGKLSNMVTDFAVVECVDLKEPHVDLCAHCGKIEILTKQIRTAGKKWAHVCKPCGEFFDGVVKKAERRE